MSYCFQINLALYLLCNKQYGNLLFVHFVLGEMSKEEEILSACTVKWGEDERTEYFEEHFNEWINQFPEEAQGVVYQLVELFEYYSHEQINQYLCDLNEKLEGSEQFDSSHAIYTLLPSTKGIANSSSDYLFEFRCINHKTKYETVLDLSKYAERENYKHIENIVIIDDYCGSGHSLATFIENHSSILKGKRIFYLVTYLMEESLSLITTTAEKHHVDVKVIFINSGKKVFDNSCMANPEEVRTVIKTCSEIFKINEFYWLGSYESQSLVAFYNDTPNNTIGLFWYDTKKYFSIFPRDFENKKGCKRPTPKSMSLQKQSRRSQNYAAKARKVENE